MESLAYRLGILGVGGRGLYSSPGSRPLHDKSAEFQDTLQEQHHQDGRRQGRDGNSRSVVGGQCKSQEKSLDDWGDFSSNDPGWDDTPIMENDRKSKKAFTLK